MTIETTLPIRRLTGKIRCCPPQANLPSGAPSASAAWKQASAPSTTHRETAANVITVNSTLVRL